MTPEMVGEIRRLIGEIRKIVQAISLKSHVSAAAVGQATPSSDEDIGGKRPSGGIARADDWSLDAQGFALKSADYFQERLDRMIRQKRVTVEALRALHDEASEALKAWGRAPLPPGQDPERDTFVWKCTIADDPRDLKTVQRIYSISRSTAKRYRAQYQGVMRTIWTS